MIMTRRHAIGVIGAAAGAALATPAIAQGRTIRVGALRFTSHAATFIALERGLFDEAGLTVEPVFFEAAQPMAVAIASGDVDYAMTAISGGLVSLAEKGAIKVFGGALSEEKGIPGQAILVSDAAYQAGVTAPGMLDGRRFGMTTAGSSFHYMGSKIAQAEGIGLEFVPLQKVGAIIGALKTGQVDGWTIVPHIASGLVASGEVHRVGEVAEYLPGYQVTTIFGSTVNVADRELTTAYLGAMNAATSIYNSTMIDRAGGEEGVAEMVALLQPYVYPDRTVKEAAPPIIQGTMRLNEGAALNVASVRDQLEWFQSEGLIDSAITLEQLIDTSYVETVGS
ncbi:ABC transporter substrate-binding protein [Jannaschia rubra]|uniref:ABC transporter, substrate-binding protein, aliphatic sulfonates family n=1 Tax=Jannaschia rubra TaxID=282197 RepID=A0A0M6XJM1_9RHOB|nr:ABC transporter substrate-binding protein [Jannaschia rubra]CTQ31299.1 ABC transporter, substrate-binding protein, aliphatic sulfonates family [Jannaschia rubra]SFF82123.1 NitT/TauT family transport system substrate-binding protein [Jannaschia rubra]